MLPYDLHKLDWLTFEQLVQALLKKHIGIGVSSFGGSKDKGRDAVFNGEAPFPSKESPSSGSWIFQVKFKGQENVGEGDFSKFLSSLRNEVQLVIGRRMHPDQYVLITNVRLTSDQKDRVLSLLRTLHNASHLLDGKDLCDLLRDDPRLRTSVPHLIDVEDIRNVFQAAHIARAESFAAGWKERLKVFVATRHYFEVFRVLASHHFVIIDGSPEVGKTTIGAATCLAHVAHGFTPYDIRRAENLQQLFDRSKRQIFICDDAMGQINYDATLGEDWSRDLPNLLYQLDGNHKLVWTSRRYIFDEALRRTKLRESVPGFPGTRDVLIEVGNHSSIELAQILYSHAKYAELSEEARSLLKSIGPVICTQKTTTPERIRRIVALVKRMDAAPFDEQHVTRLVFEELRSPGDSFKRAYWALSSEEKRLLLCLLERQEPMSERQLQDRYGEMANVLP